VKDKYAQGICEFPGGAASDVAERLAEELARIAIEFATAEVCEQLGNYFNGRRAA